ncbi:MAG: glycosyltransferase [Microthrixaceae bacterium]|nr:glycosyltransferase [Microthrixaceae bacterium]
MPFQRLRAWLRSSDAPLPRRVRSVRQELARVSARRRHGSVIASMEATVASVPRLPPRKATRSTAAPRRIVALSTYALHPANAGGPLRGLHLATALAREADLVVEVISTTVHPDLAGRRRLGDRLHETTVACSDEHLERVTALRLPSGPVSITDIGVALMWSGLPELVDVLGESLERSTAAILVQPYLGPAALHLAAGMPLVADEHNDEWCLKSELLPCSDGGRWLVEQVDRIERDAVEHSSLLTVATDADLESLGQRYHLPEHRDVVPNGVDTTAIAFVTGELRARNRKGLIEELDLPDGPLALFVGSAHGPNIDAGRRIAAQATDSPEVTFLLAGGHSSVLGLRRLPPNVVALGAVDNDLHERLLAGCDVALNPMETGSGSNLKLLSYLAAGLPVVSTELGARGVDASGAGIRICRIDEMAGSVETMLEEAGSHRATAGRDHVVAHHDWTAIGRHFVELCRETVLS